MYMNIPTNGADLTFYETKMKLKRPLFMHTIIHYTTQPAFNIAELYLIDRLKQELITNIHLQREINYQTGKIILRKKELCNVLTLFDCDDIYEFAHLIYKNIEQYNQSIIINIS